MSDLPTILFLAPDGAGDPSLWEGTSTDDPRPIQLLRKGDVPPAGRETVWALLEGLAEPVEDWQPGDAPGGQRCPRCGEYDTVTVDHGPGWQFHGHALRRHDYCRNCDNGLCSGEC